MDLAKRCSHEFGSGDWQRGTAYFREGAVSILDEAPTGLVADVRGSRASPYAVELDWSQARDGTIYASCTCPRFDDVGQCKHIVATILAADAKNLAKRVPGRKPLVLEPADADEVGFGDEVDSEVDYFNAPGWFELPEGLILDKYGLQEIKQLIEDGAADRLPPPRRSKPPVKPGWKQQLDLLSDQTRLWVDENGGYGHLETKHPSQLWYLLDIERTLEDALPCIALHLRRIKKDGSPGKPQPFGASLRNVDNLSREDRELVELLIGNERQSRYDYSYGGYERYAEYRGFAIAPAMFDLVLPRLCDSGRFGWSDGADSARRGEIHSLRWDEGSPWRLKLDVAKTADKKHWQVDGVLVRNDETEPLSRPLAILALGLVVFPDRMARFDPGGTFLWTLMLRQSGPLLIPVKQQEAFVERIAQLPEAPQADWPEELRWQREQGVPRPRLTIKKSERGGVRDLHCDLSFRYGEEAVPLGTGPPVWYDRRQRLATHRDLGAERAAAAELVDAGAKPPRYYDSNAVGRFLLAPTKLPNLVGQLTGAGWEIEAEGRLIRHSGSLSLSVKSGVDWFELEGVCDYGGVTASLPKLLAALRRGEEFVVLDDGSQGMLPSEWLQRYGALAEMGQPQGERLRFAPAQAMLLDSLLAAQEPQHVAVDRAFARLRDRLRSFDGVRPRKEPRSFQGELRPYQREGLGWLRFLDEFEFGGCLADDMGLGKTVQVLALLDQRRSRQRSKAPRSPSLVVVPRSLVFNWIEEARRFTPKLRVLNYTGLDRRAVLDQLTENDLVVTTYGTLRRDIGTLREIDFDYAILDESQAIKNASAQAAKACRLLRAQRRLAMTGTPVENHVGELWSLFEFLNPGMLGRNQQLTQLFSKRRSSRGTNGDNSSGASDADGVAILSRALRPFMLRRTKQQVLSDLPDKTEQTLYCELGKTERGLYEELREHYRRALLERVQKVGVNRSKIQVLEALLRLRQAACHPGLLDKKRVGTDSAKLETLLEQLAEVLDEGHKALVFSQFTSLLAIVRRHLDGRRITYEYLDGKTTKRQAKVERFQNDPDCPLFLISLKAGGYGLNLTAAEYVFILDPWWNPAVESQAVDRAHRIGQQRHVFAYRLIARDTVEEKILQLQDQKRGLAEAIISADNSVLRNLTAEDLQLLLS